MSTTDVIERCAEIAHDTFYDVTAEVSDLGYVFLPEKEKQTWRVVAMNVLRVYDTDGDGHE